MKYLANSVNRNKIPVECLLNNFIDKEFQSSYKALNFTDSLFLNSKFMIMNNFITPNSMKSHLKSIIGATLQIALHIYRFFYLRETFKRFLNSNVIPSLLCFIEITCIVATVLIYAINMIQSKNSALLMIKIQQSLRVFNSEKGAGDIMKQHKLWNWMSIIVIFSIYGSYAGVSVFGSLALGRGLYSLSSILTAFADVIFDTGVIYVTRTVDLISKILRLWNIKMAANKQMHLAVLQEKAQNEGTSAKALLQAHMNLIKSFRLCKNIFQFSIILHVVQTFFLILISLQILIEFGSFGLEDKINIYTIATRIVSTVYISKSVILLINLSIACKQFYEQVRISEETCMQVLNLTHTRDLRRLCKNVLRFNRASFRKLSACGVFAVDAALPLRLLAVVLTYTVVLLQFAFLTT